ncbi:MAG: hypothetical protein EBU81_03425 [Proteobacteria bacterium]|nr:hypothetical protein [Pseudomonadota bacterium]
MIEWHIQSRAHACQRSGRQFQDGETYHTLLLDTKAGFERMDLCVESFKEVAAELLAKANLVSHWKGVYEAPPPVPPDAIRKDDAESLLRKLLERREERHAAAAYILTVMLERKRILRVKGQTRDNGRRIFVYEHPKSGRTLQRAQRDPVAGPGLNLSDRVSTGPVAGNSRAPCPLSMISKPPSGIASAIRRFCPWH